MAGQGQLTLNFHIREFKCNDGTLVPEEFFPNVLEVARNLQVLRDDLNANKLAKVPHDAVVTLHVNSGYRTKEYNHKVGGKPASQHLKAHAADITSNWYTPAQIRSRIEILIKEGKMKQGGLGKYPGFTHYDPRGTKARW